MTDVESLEAAELRFQQAHLASDVAELDRLLHPDLTFVGPDGELSDKDADLAAHRSGIMRIDRLETEDLIVRVADGVGVTVLTARLEGEYGGRAFSFRMRYTRCWARGSDGWRIVAAHAGTLEPLPT